MRYGDIIKEEINNLNIRYKVINVDDYIIMPNHIHLIIKIMKKSNISVGDIICTYKSITTKRSNKINKTNGKQMWQRNYYEHVIRNEKEYHMILEYMNNNPIRWLNKIENNNNANENACNWAEQSHAPTNYIDKKRK